MEFVVAIRSLASGLKVRRRGWIPGAFIQATTVDDKVDPAKFVKSFLPSPPVSPGWTPTLEDLTATDWGVAVPKPGSK